MKTESNHIIEKVLVEIDTRKVETANSIKNNIGLFLNVDLFSKIETALSMADRNNVLIRINQMNIYFSLPVNTDFSKIDTSVSVKIEEQIKQQIFAKIHDILNNSSKSETSQNQQLTQQENQEQIFLFFLENGFYPWYGNRSHINEFVKTKQWITSFANSVFIEKLKIILKKQGVFQRFVFQFPTQMVYIFLSHINSRITENALFQNLDNTFQPLIKSDLLNSLFFISTESESWKIVVAIEKMFQQLTNESEKEQLKFIQLIFKTIPESIFGTPEFQKMINNLPVVQKKQVFQNLPDGIKISTQKRKFEILAETNGFDLLPKKQQENTEFFDNDLAEILVQNAGLILLHPFLKHFFTVLNLLDKHNQILKDKKFAAVQILHFLATGEEEFYEGELVFEKFICGVPLNYTIPKQSLISLEMKQEAENLLTETIKNWPALKNTSPGGLRQMFLQRNGKLVHKNERFKLVMERKAQDVLLEKLDWNVSIIQLPWRKELLTVDW